MFSVQQRGNIDGTGALLANSNAVAPKTVTYNYNLASQVTDVRRYSDTSSTNLEVHTRNTYDQAGRLRSITHGKSEIAAGQSWNGTSTLPASLGAANMLAGYFMVYDRDNRLTSLASQKDAFRTTYTYNTDDELTAATSTQIAGMTLPNPLPAAESYNPDLMGNRRTSAGVSQSANGTQNQLQTDGTFNYLYDGEGNTTRRTTIATGAVVEYTWDFRNRMTSVTEKTSATGTVTKRVEFVYDAFDRRVAKRIDNDGNGTWDRYDAWLWDGQGEIEQFRDSDGQGTSQGFRISNRYLFGGNVDELLSDEQYSGNTGFALGSTTPSTTAGNTLWALTDHLGSVRDVVDNNGVIRQHVVYDGFGRRLREVDYNAAGAVIAGTDPAAIDVLFGYTGRDWDADVALQYNRARWYDPATGRWTSRDPIGFAAGDGNLYRYVGNGATGATDPSGLKHRDPNDIPWGHHIFPRTSFENIPDLSKEIIDYFNSLDARIADKDYTAHTGGRYNAISEVQYRCEVEKIAREFIENGSKNTLPDAKKLIASINGARESNPFIGPYLAGVEEEMRFQKQLIIDAEEAVRKAGKEIDDKVRKEIAAASRKGAWAARQAKTAAIIAKYGGKLLSFGAFFWGASNAMKDGLTAAEAGRLCADLSPLGYSFAGAEMLAAAYDELERELEPQTSGHKWIRDPKPFIPNPLNPNPFGMDAKGFPTKQRRGVY